MYQAGVQPGRGKRDRIVRTICTTIKGNYEGRKLFTVMKDLFITAMDKLLDETSKKLKAATDECCENINVDLRLLDVVVPAVDQGVFIQTLSGLLEQSKIDRDRAQEEFDSEFPGPAQSI